MKYMVPVFAVAAGSILVVLLICCIYVAMCYRLVHNRTKIEKMLESKIDLMEKEHQRNLATTEFLYKLLIDMVTPAQNESILYKARSIQVILMIMDIQNNPEKAVDTVYTALNMPTTEHIDVALKDIYQKHQGYDVLEPETRSAYDRFIELLDLIEQEEEDLKSGYTNHYYDLVNDVDEAEELEDSDETPDYYEPPKDVIIQKSDRASGVVC